MILLGSDSRGDSGAVTPADDPVCPDSFPQAQTGTDHQSSVRKGATGSPAVLYRFPGAQSLKQ